MLTLRDYAEGSWGLVAVCGGCGRRGPRLEPVVPVRKQAFVGGLL